MLNSVLLVICYSLFEKVGNLIFYFYQLGFGLLSSIRYLVSQQYDYAFLCDSQTCGISTVSDKYSSPKKYGYRNLIWSLEDVQKCGFKSPA